jgi:hypothetical protein
VAIAGIGFYGGMQYQSSRRAVIGEQFAGMRNGQQIPRGRGPGMGFMSGEVIRKDDASVTVKLQNGSTSIAFYSQSTAIEKAASGSWSDIVVGKSISIRGTKNADGTYTAQTIQLTPPQMRPTASQLPK